MVYKCKTDGFNKQLLLGALFIRTGINKGHGIWTDIQLSPLLYVENAMESEGMHETLLNL